MIALKDVTKAYDTTILEHIHMDFYENHIYVMKGHSGSGKSTLCHMIAGLDREYEGSILVDDVNLKEMNQRQQKAFFNRIGFVYQESLLIKDLTIEQNLTFIHDDEQEIKRLAIQFDVLDTLHQYPWQLSNGQRQRISIIRTLLSHPDIILLDEPSASLDQERAKKLAILLKTLKSEDRIVIISTHDSCFDDIADVMIDLKDGNLVIQKENHPLPTKQKSQKEPLYPNRHLDFTYAMRHFKEKGKQFLFYIVTSILFAILFFTFSFQHSFSNTMETYYETSYPLQPITISGNIGKTFQNHYEVEKMPFYSVPWKNVMLVNLYEEKDSSLHVSGVIEVGTFPTNKEEILLSNEAAKTLFPNKDKKQIVGETLEINGVGFTISGVLSDSEETKTAYLANPNYFYQNDDLIFMQEEAIALLGKPKDLNNEVNILVKLKEEKLNSELYQDLNQRYVIQNPYYNQIYEMQYSVDFIFQIICMSILAFSIILFVFMYIVIALDLYYRRKEIGYLQLFHVEKKRIRNILYLEYMMRLIPCFLIGLFIYGMLLSVIAIWFDFILPWNIGLCLILMGIIWLYVSLWIFIPVQRFLKTDVLKLIR